MREKEQKIKEEESRLQFLAEIQSFFWNLILSFYYWKDLIHILPEALRINKQTSDSLLRIRLSVLFIDFFFIVS
jgi:hypothetical protein